MSLDLGLGISLKTRRGLVNLIDQSVGSFGSTFIARGTQTAAGDGYWTLETTSVVSGTFGLATATPDPIMTIGNPYRLVVECSAFTRSGASTFNLLVKESNGQGSQVGATWLTVTGTGTFEVEFTPTRDTLTVGMDGTTAVIGDTATVRVSLYAI